ncbi:MAG TPA: GAF domain-containing protein [Candidatus Limnocylindria bacterium]|jgi:K+-sensing histidine kinase KdpD/putative methionine-R-sulfoxide reductase with GAF domain
MSASDAERKLGELSFLHEVARLASSARDWDEMLRVVIGRTTDAMGAEVSSLYLLERSDGVLRLVATNGLNRGGIGRATLRVGEGIVGWVANARVPLAARDVRTDPRWKWVPEVDEKRFTSMLSVPVVARDEVIGVMNVQTVQPRDFGREEIDFLQTIANQVAGIIEKGRLQRESDRKLREVSALFEVSNVLTSTLDLDEVLSLIVDRLVRVYPGASGAILLREEGEAVRERARTGELGKTAGAAAQQALDERRPIVAFDHIAVPLIANDRLLGAVVLQVPDYKEFLEEEVRFVGALANQAALAIDKASLYALERKTTESLRELERARSDFVAVVTHDLRTPLSVIRGHLEMLAEKNGKSKLPISEATAQVLRLDELVDRILAGVRTDRPELSLKRARFDLRATVTAALKEVAPMARRHKLSGPRAGQAVFVRGDRRRTAEVVAGLVHNATKYAPQGTRIVVKIERAGDRAIVRVQDEGRGVPPNERSRIFEPYARGAGNDEVPGSGIGLFASRRVVEGQGGDLWVEDAPEGGAVFAFSVPLARAAAEAASR